jgi:quinol monooxygenase YgiN
MIKKSLLVRLEAKPGKEKEVEEFLKSAQSLAENEKDTITWYALRINENTFGIFDTFEGDDGRDAHLSGPIAKALMSKAAELLSKAPVIEKVDVLAVKEHEAAHA